MVCLSVSLQQQHHCNHGCTVTPQVVTGLDVDASGNVYLAGQGASVVYKVNTAGIISIVCGTPLTASSSGDGGLATDATLFNPTDVKVDAAGEGVPHGQSGPSVPGTC